MAFTAPVAKPSSVDKKLKRLLLDGILVVEPAALDALVVGVVVADEVEAERRLRETVLLLDA